MITGDSESAEIFNQYLRNIVPDLGLKIPNVLTHQSPKVKDHILNTIYKY